jgi:hypothetical protein
MSAILVRIASIARALHEALDPWSTASADGDFTQL